VNPSTNQRRPRVVIIGGGFAGLEAAKGLRRTPVDVTLVDRRNHHLFQPLLYQVATAALSPADIAAPIRKVLRRQPNARVVLAEVTGIDLDHRIVRIGRRELPYDYLVVAAGATHSYFGHDEWAPFAPGLKTVEDAVEIRRRILLAFEAAELEEDDDERTALLTFVIVGAGPTGVELAGAIAEIALQTVRRDFRSFDTADTRIVLVEGADRVIPAFPESASTRARKELESLGVEVMLGRLATDIDARGVTVGDERIAARNVVWAAGVEASPLGAMLGAPVDRSGRVEVGPDLTVPDRPEVFVIGDLARVVDAAGVLVPGMAPGAMQMGRYVASIIDAETRSRRSQHQPFRFTDKGMLATIGRRRAVACFGRRVIDGTIAWILWAIVHIFYLIGFRNRLIVMLQWAWLYFFFDRGARLITGERNESIE
jgi:NADH dehydrogenase